MDKSTKVCTSCGEDKDLLLFSKKSSGKFGRNAQCKVCKSAYYTKTKVERKVAQKLYRDTPENKELAKVRSSVWRKDNPDLVVANNKKYFRKHYLENKEKYFFKAGLRDSRVKQATPVWANLEDIFRVYKLCRRISKETGIPHEVDHVIPLQGKNVCGLHTFKNLRIIPRKNNRQKSNTWIGEWE